MPPSHQIGRLLSVAFALFKDVAMDDTDRPCAQ